MNVFDFINVSFATKRAIVIAAIVEMHKYGDIARENRVKPSVISHLVQKAKRNPEFLKELEATEIKRDQRSLNIISTTEKLIKEGDSLLSAKAVSKRMNSERIQGCEARHIRQILREEFKMKYKRVHKVQKHSNSHRSIVLRSRFAKCFLGLLKSIVRVSWAAWVDTRVAR